MRPSIAFRAVVIIGLATLLTSCLGLGLNAAIIVAGRVVDEQGKPLEQIRLSIRENRVSLAKESFLASHESTRELPAGRFRVRCRTCSSLELSFSKDGYYSETRSFQVANAEQSNSRVTSRAAADLERTDLQIVLRSNANMARLVEYASYLSTGTEGPVTVAPLRRGLGPRVAIGRLNEPLGTDARNLPGYVRLLATVTDEGVLAVEDPDARVRRPRSPILDFSKADGGVILYRFTADKPQDVYRSMRTAPAEGYQPTLKLETANGGSGRTYYFYCRFGDIYGKGTVTVPGFGYAKDGQDVVRTHIEMRLNLDGSRNVETAF